MAPQKQQTELGWLSRVAVMALSMKAAWKPKEHTHSEAEDSAGGKEELSPVEGQKLHPIPRGLPMSFLMRRQRLSHRAL